MGNYTVNQYIYIFHYHVHIIPRRKGDLDKPKDGIRGVMPNKQTINFEILRKINILIY